MNVLRGLVAGILTWEARFVLARFKPRIIAVTGSVGKTTTKDAIFAALSEHVYVRKSEKSYNSEIGVPLTILGFENAWRNPFLWLWNLVKGLALIIMPDKYPQWLVLEVGADRPGDIRRIAHWLKPDIVVMTGVPNIPVHVEYFRSPEELVREKQVLAEYLKPGGKLIVNGDDVRMREFRSTFRGACITFGIEENNDCRGEKEEIVYERGEPIGVQFRVNYKNSSFPISIFGALGRPRVYAALAALVVGEAIGVDMVSMARSLTQWAPPPGRLRLVRGLRGSIIIDDTYNSSPAAAMAALDTLKNVDAKRRIAVLGDMLELGKYAAEAHKQVGERAVACADVLFTVGFRARTIGEAALDAGISESDIREYEHSEAERAGKELELELKEGDVVLVKGSQAMRMERTVLEIMAEPARAEELLVRQDPAWLAKP